MKNPKLNPYQENLLQDIYNIVLSPDTPQKERTILLYHKQAIEKGNYFPQIMRQLERDLRPLAIKRELSKPVSELYMKVLSSRREDPQGAGPGLLI